MLSPKHNPWETGGAAGDELLLLLFPMPALFLPSRDLPLLAPPIPPVAMLPPPTIGLPLDPGIAGNHPIAARHH